MAAAVTDQEVDNWLANSPWPGRDTPLWSREQSRAYLAAERTAREQHEAKRAAEAARQAKGTEGWELPVLRAEVVALRAEIAQLRGAQSSHARRLKQIERLVAFEPGEKGRKGGILVEAITDAFGENARRINERLREIHKSLDALEKRPAGLTWEGTWTPEKGYPASGVVIKDGGAWVALAPTCPGDKPGASGEWRLMMRSDETMLRKLLRDELRKPGTWA